MADPIYVDLDETLIHAIVDPFSGNIERILVRPGASEFLKALSRYGDVVLLTHAMRSHARAGLKAIGAASKYITKVISRENMESVIQQLEAIDSESALSEKDRRELYAQVWPIAKSGVMFDDMSVGSWLQILKSAALGIPDKMWIQVNRRDWSKGLERAYRQFVKSFVRQRALKGTA